MTRRLLTVTDPCNTNISSCKNFFKRSVVIVQNKPYVCSNHNRCDVRIVYDKSGIKRKGARCQACRYTACLDAGMSHPGGSRATPAGFFSTLFVSGFPRSRGGRHSVYKPDKQDLSFQSSLQGSLGSYKDHAEELPDLENESSWDNSSSTSEINSTTWDSLNDQLRDTFCKAWLSSDQSDDQRTEKLKLFLILSFIQVCKLCVQ